VCRFQAAGATTIYSIASRFNHACKQVRNVRYETKGAEGDFAIELHVAVPIIKKGTELTITYGSPPAVLMKTYGFRCTCGGCMEPISERDARDLVVKQRRPRRPSRR
jgi:hypothetical protein